MVSALVKPAEMRAARSSRIRSLASRPVVPSTWDLGGDLISRQRLFQQALEYREKLMRQDDGATHPLHFGRSPSEPEALRSPVLGSGMRDQW